MIGLLNAAIVKLHLLKEQTRKLLDWVACLGLNAGIWPFSDMASKKRQRFRISSSFEAERSNYAGALRKFNFFTNVPITSDNDYDCLQTGLEKNLFGNHPVPLHGTESRSPPPAFASEPLIQASAAGGGEYNGGNFPFGKDAASTARPVDLGIVEIDEPSSATSSLPNHDSNFMKSTSAAGGPGATTRKSAVQVERQNSEASYYADDEDGNRKKYSRRGTFRHKFLRSLLPFWSSALPTLPVTAPPQKDVLHADDAPEGRLRHRRSSRMDPRKILLVTAIMACMATMGILYYRIAQRGLGDDLPGEGLQ
ncbi:UNVERIFIED_CONTAM: hypothetical protein Sradi_1464200 [Sesamum radiatum]|uniref:Uncharacterized protein n=1 Tax=Sesamum radiatum TaxID=300843 RepID=A0AAW2U6S7_SESRA